MYWVAVKAKPEKARGDHLFMTRVDVRSQSKGIFQCPWAMRTLDFHVHTVTADNVNSAVRLFFRNVLADLANVRPSGVATNHVLISSIGQYFHTRCCNVKSQQLTCNKGKTVLDIYSQGAYNYLGTSWPTSCAIIEVG